MYSCFLAYQHSAVSFEAHFILFLGRIDFLVQSRSESVGLIIPHWVWLLTFLLVYWLQPGQQVNFL